MNPYETMDKRHQCVYNIITNMISTLHKLGESGKQNDYKLKPTPNSQLSYVTGLDHIHNHTALRAYNSVRDILIVKNIHENAKDANVDYNTRGDYFGQLNIDNPHVHEVGFILSDDKLITMDFINTKSRTIEEELFQLSTIHDPNVLNTLVFMSLIRDELIKVGFSMSMFSLHMLTSMDIDKLIKLDRNIAEIKL